MFNKMQNNKIHLEKIPTSANGNFYLHAQSNNEGNLFSKYFTESAIKTVHGSVNRRKKVELLGRLDEEYSNSIMNLHIIEKGKMFLIAVVISVIIVMLVSVGPSAKMSRRGKGQARHNRKKAKK